LVEDGIGEVTPTIFVGIALLTGISCELCAIDCALDAEAELQLGRTIPGRRLPPLNRIRR